MPFLFLKFTHLHSLTSALLVFAKLLFYRMEFDRKEEDYGSFNEPTIILSNLFEIQSQCYQLEHADLLLLFECHQLE